MREKINRLFLVFSLFLFFGTVQAQEENIVPGDILVKLQEDVDVNTFCNDFKRFRNENINLRPTKRLAQTINLWLLQFDPEQVSQKSVLNQIKKHEDVLIAQFNHTNIKRRLTPDDTQFASQWSMNNTGQTGGTSDADVDALEAWDITTGGTTTQGDEIVVAVIDGGCDITHPDLIPNLWKNTAEIPNNGIDDDNNGYVDDFDGWNANNSNGTVPSDSHGTHVCGTVGAKGNNAEGVAGVNLDVKVMPISGSSGIESIVIEAYGYVLDARTLYNTSNGAQGAFVVSTNASFGVNFGNPTNFPLWCDMYNTLGAQGVLSAGATMNLAEDVDAVGDVPTACSSDYLIAVTNTTSTDGINGGAAWGLTTIDIGAPGTGILSTLPGNAYGNNTGTSMATPHIAGAVGLLVAAACDDFITNYKNDPGTYALQLKDALLNGADPIAALSQTGSTPTVTGGRLNLYNSILELNPGANGECTNDFSLSTNQISQEICAPTNAVYTIDVTALLGFSDPVNLSVSGNPTGTTANFSSPTVTPTGASILTISNTSAATPGTYTITVTGNSTTTPKTLDLELIVQSNVPTAPTLSSPTDMTTNVPSSATFSWNMLAEASNYQIDIATDAAFTNIVETASTATTSYSVASVLTTNTMYYWRVTPSNFCGVGTVSTTFSFTTETATYCPNAATDTENEEWIESVEIAGVLNTTGIDNGYGDYTSLVIPMQKGQTYNFTLTPAWDPNGGQFDEYWRIWIDYNLNGDFSDAGEMVFDAGVASQNVETGMITIPATATTGLVRMRVIMRFSEAPEPCVAFNFGEVEDYTIQITDACQVDVAEAGNYAAGVTNTIESDTYINSTATVENGANITYDAADCIELQATFEVELGAEFLTRIEGCGGLSIQEEADEK